VQLAIDKLRAARLFAPDAQLVGGDQTIDDSLNGFSFFLGKKEPAGLVEGFRRVIGEGRPARRTFQGDGVSRAGDGSGYSQRRPGQYLASRYARQRFGSFSHVASFSRVIN